MKIITPKLRDTMIHNLFGGVAWGLGITVGIALITYVLGLTVSTVGGFPVVGDVLAKIVNATLNSLNQK